MSEIIILSLEAVSIILLCACIINLNSLRTSYIKEIRALKTSVATLKSEQSEDAKKLMEFIAVKSDEITVKNSSDSLCIQNIISSFSEEIGSAVQEWQSVKSEIEDAHEKSREAERLFTEGVSNILNYETPIERRAAK